MPKALGIAQSLSRDTELSEAARGRILLDWDRILGLDLETSLPEPSEPAEADPELAKWVEAKIMERAQARATKDWAASDRIRDELARRKVVVKDTAQGPVWLVSDTPS